jgi:hypothetical protein
MSACSQVLPHAIDVTRLCSAALAAASCSAEKEAASVGEEAAWLQLARRAFDFASAAVQVDPGKSLGGGNVSHTSAHSSCNAVTSSIECWCSNDRSSCPWEPLVNADALQGMLHDAPLPLSLAASLDKVQLNARHCSCMRSFPSPTPPRVSICRPPSSARFGSARRLLQRCCDRLSPLQYGDHQARIIFL